MLSARPWVWAGAGKCLGSGSFGVVYAAKWDGIPVVIKFAGETCDNSFECTHSLLQHEEAIYRHVDRHLEKCTGAAYLPLANCCDRAWTEDRGHVSLRGIVAALAVAL